MEKSSTEYDVLIIGAGVQGSATAYYLTNKLRVERVLLLERVRNFYVKCVELNRVLSYSGLLCCGLVCFLAVPSLLVVNRLNKILYPLPSSCLTVCL